MYACYATNNFEELANPPAYEPTRCSGCNGVIKLASDGYTKAKGGRHCLNCYALPR